ncbi:RNA ligase with possible intron [Serratia phage SP1]|nr:RNA ligase with possible intron [Serratia phage SP1]
MAIKYSSIENHYREGTIERVRNMGLTSSEVAWVAREKLHGANFSFVLSNQNVNGNTSVTCEFHTRNTKLELMSSFHGFLDIHKKYASRLRDIFLEIQSKYSTPVKVQVFGELIGPAVCKGLKVNYGPENDFVGFDIAVLFENGESIYLDDVFVDMLFTLSHIPTAPLLGTGTFDDLAKLPRNFKSKYIEVDGDNEAEGFVLKPVYPAKLPNGSRVIFKFKSDRFSERKQTKVKKVVPNMSESDADKLLTMSAYINQARIDAVMSKENFTVRDFGRVQGLVAKDALEDIEKDGLSFEFDDKRRVLKDFQAEIAKELRPIWNSIF